MSKKEVDNKSEIKEKKAAKKSSYSKKKKVKKSIPNGIAYVQSTFNNTIVSIADSEGNVISWSSAGQKIKKIREKRLQEKRCGTVAGYARSALVILEKVYFCRGKSFAPPQKNLEKRTHEELNQEPQFDKIIETREMVK